MTKILNVISIPEKSQKKYIAIAAGAFLLAVLQIWAIVGAHCGVQQPPKQLSAGQAGSAYAGGDEAVLEDTATADDEFSRKIIIPKLVNQWNLLDSTFVPNGLVSVGTEIEGRSDLKINATVRQAYLLMQEDMRAQGVKPPMLISAYRSYEYQKQLYDKKVAELGPNQKVTAVPGTSEHQYGASVDISTDGTCQNNFGETKAGIWIAENSYKYGFVVRYATEKKELTGINFEPWHIRYVGVEHATAMFNSGMCLEEYVEYLRANYPYAVEELSPDQFPAPRWAGDTGEGDAPPSSSDAPVQE